VGKDRIRNVILYFIRYSTGTGTVRYRYIGKHTVSAYVLGEERLDSERRSLLLYRTSVAEPEPQGAASFGQSRSRNAMRLRRLQFRQWY
jgi:hypothetical protein